jgi:hypothetical protein
MAKKNPFRNIQIQRNCGPRKELAAGREITHRTKVGRRKGNILRNKWAKAKAKAERGIRGVRTLREKLRKRHEDTKRVKDLGGGRPRYLRERGLKKLRLESKENVIKTDRKPTGLEIAMRFARSTVGLQRIKDWTLWKGRSPPKQKKKLQVEREPVM